MFAGTSLLLSLLAFVAASNAVLHSVALTSMQQSFFAESAAYERFMGRWSRQGRSIAGSVCRHTRRAGGPRRRLRHGALALAAAQVAPSAQITGVDPSASYVSRTGRAPTERVRFVVGDAQALQMPDATFDVWCRCSS